MINIVSSWCQIV